VMGLATLVRPQTLLLAPLVGALAARPPWGASGWRPALKGAVVASLLAVACVAPWTARNCWRMHRCVFVSANGGWNLAIGTTTRTGAWEPLVVPPECATVWEEAAKDACFARAALVAIAGSPGEWIARAPAKLAATFDYFGAAPWYLHESNPEAFRAPAKEALGAVETVACRLLLIAALVACARLDGPRRRARAIVAAVGAAAALTEHGWLGYLAVPACVALAGPASVSFAPAIVPLASGAIVATACVHAVLFGAGRYGLAVAPFVAGLAFAGHGCTLRPVDAVRAIAGARTPAAREESPSSTEHDAG
jgi:hypothetical protein